MLHKSDIHSALQCPRKFWLEKNRPDIDFDVDLGSERRKSEGIMVGDLSRRLLGPNIIWPQTESSKEDAAEIAKRLLLSAPNAPAVEVPLFFNGLYARADALLPAPGGHILRETKASTFPLKKDKVTPEKPDEKHIVDMAMQAWVMEKSGLPMVRAELNLVNNRWEYEGDGVYDGMFRHMDVTQEVRALMDSVPGWVADAEALLTQAMPAIETGKHCSAPHGCQFMSYCQPLDAPRTPHPIELLPDSAGKGLAKKLKAANGYVSLLEPKPEELTGASQKLYQRMQECHRTGLPFLAVNSGKDLKDLPYPRYYFDFEGIDLAIPQWKGVRPYEQIPFQWSCHIERAPGVFELGEFLDVSGKDPSLGCIEQMLKVIDLEDDGPIFVYFAQYERGRLEGLAERHPQYAAQMERYISRLVDLLPIVKEHYYHPKMRGSFSIKKVLPVIAPDLDYKDLTEVQGGTEAQLAYIRIALLDGYSDEEKARTEQNARIYCRQDTWAMVETAYFLARQSRPIRPAGM